MRESLTQRWYAWIFYYLFCCGANVIELENIIFFSDRRSGSGRSTRIVFRENVSKKCVFIIELCLIFSIIFRVFLEKQISAEETVKKCNTNTKEELEKFTIKFSLNPATRKSCFLVIFVYLYRLSLLSFILQVRVYNIPFNSSAFFSLLL